MADLDALVARTQAEIGELITKPKMVSRTTRARRRQQSPRLPPACPSYCCKYVFAASSHAWAFAVGLATSACHLVGCTSTENRYRLFFLGTLRGGCRPGGQAPAKATLSIHPRYRVRVDGGYRVRAAQRSRALPIATYFFSCSPSHSIRVFFPSPTCTTRRVLCEQLLIHCIRYLAP
jgi:hypothetical protein